MSRRPERARWLSVFSPLREGGGAAMDGMPMNSQRKVSKAATGGVLRAAVAPAFTQHKPRVVESSFTGALSKTAGPHHGGASTPCEPFQPSMRLARRARPTIGGLRFFSIYARTMRTLGTTATRNTPPAAEAAPPSRRGGIACARTICRKVAAKRHLFYPSLLKLQLHSRAGRPLPR